MIMLKTSAQQKVNPASPVQILELAWSFIYLKCSSAGQVTPSRDKSICQPRAQSDFYGPTESVRARWRGCSQGGEGATIPPKSNSIKPRKYIGNEEPAWNFRQVPPLISSVPPRFEPHDCRGTHPIREVSSRRRDLALRKISTGISGREYDNFRPQQVVNAARPAAELLALQEIYWVTWEPRKGLLSKVKNIQFT